MRAKLSGAGLGRAIIGLTDGSEKAKEVLRGGLRAGGKKLDCEY